MIKHGRLKYSTHTQSSRPRRLRPSLQRCPVHPVSCRLVVWNRLRSFLGKLDRQAVQDCACCFLPAQDRLLHAGVRPCKWLRTLGNKQPRSSYRLSIRDRIANPILLYHQIAAPVPCFSIQARPSYILQLFIEIFCTSQVLRLSPRSLIVRDYC
jgi:hypothetical protein